MREMEEITKDMLEIARQEYGDDVGLLVTIAAPEGRVLQSACAGTCNIMLSSALASAYVLVLNQLAASYKGGEKTPSKAARDVLAEILKDAVGVLGPC